MNKILVPVDFYETSFAAFNYAAHFAILFPEAEITLLHVINGSFNTNDVVVFSPMIARRDAAINRLTFFHEEYPKEIGVHLPAVDVKKEVRYGIPGFCIADFANDYGFDLVIMGTRDQHSLFDRILGSASAITVRMAKCPVMLIHENVKYNKPQHITFAFDAKSDLEPALADFYSVNAILQAKTDFVHVHDKSKDNLSRQKMAIVEEMFAKNKPTFSFEIKAIYGTDVHAALEDYCLFEKSDMLVMMHRAEGMFSNLFKQHHSVRMAQEFHLPVLVFHEDNHLT